MKDPSWRFSYSEVGSHLSRMTPTLSASGELSSGACTRATVDPQHAITLSVRIYEQR